MSDAAARTAQEADNSIVIEYSMVAIEEIRRLVARGLAQSLRGGIGGIEVGGVLYGSHEGHKMRIEAVRPIPSEHAAGASFTLSDADRAKFQEQLAKDGQDARLEQFVRVGWFVSHGRGELALTESDVEIFGRYFKEPWQVTLIVCPDRGVAMKAAFFWREPDGSLHPDKRQKEFNFPDRLAGVIDAPPRGGRPDVRAAGRPSQQPVAPVRIERSSAQASSTDGTRYHPSPIPQQKMWPWMAGGAALLVIAILFAIRFWQVAQPQSLGLIISEREGQLQIEWSNTTRSTVRASSGSLSILDGSNVQRIALSRAQLAEGRYMYTRKSADVEVRMEVESEGDTIRESSSFLGRPPVVAPSVPSTDAAKIDPQPTSVQPAKSAPIMADPEKSALQDENRRLRQENAAMRERIQQQERMEKILESRLGITGK